MIAPAFWRTKSRRARALLGAAGAAALALLLFAFVWLPLERERARIAASLPQLRDSVLEMRAQAEEAKALRALPAPGAAATASLASLVASGELAQGLAGAQLSALDRGRLRLALEDASWTRIVEWLATAHSLHGLVVEEAEVEARAAKGRVRAQFVLAAP